MTSSALAMSYEDGCLLRKDYLLYQAWSTSRNYYFGSTVEQNKLYALAWQLVYTTLLPANYPYKEKLLAPYKDTLSVIDVERASALAKRLVTQYRLNPPFSEEELARAYWLRDLINDWSGLQFFLPAQTTVSKFKDWITWIANNVDQDLAEALDNYAYHLFLAHQFPIVYGQIIVKGPELPQMVQTAAKIFPNGFFVGQPIKHEMSFALAGYKRVVVKLNNNKIQSLPAIILEQLPHNKKTGIIGRVLPWHGLAKGNILLIADSALTAHKNNPWLQPTIPLTITEAGEFYATGLATGRYLLFINTAGLNTKIKVTLKEGETRGLSLIKLSHNKRT